MKQYEYDEINKMQSRALERVQNMKSRADSIVKETENSEKDSAKQSFYNAVLSTPKPEHIKMPSNFPENPSQAYENFSSFFTGGESVQNKETENAPSLFSGSITERDRSLLLPLFMLLKADGADEDLLMSLIYIML